MKILSIVGARPQFVKASIVSKSLRKLDNINEIIVHTGQHYDIEMSDIFFSQLQLPTPDYNLGIGSGSHGTQTGQMLAKLEAMLDETQPDWVMVYGDTNSTLAGALAAAKKHVPVAHVEAGLRSFDRRMPEEINRVLTDHISELLLPPTELALCNLHREGLADRDIRMVGDVMYDAALAFSEIAEHESRVLDQFNLRTNEYVLATIHRAENTDHPGALQGTVDALIELAREITVILPLHPRTRSRASEFGCLSRLETELLVCKPVGYLDMAKLTQHARLVVTDSGGLQKEAYFHGTPCATLRDRTEWVELVDLGWNTLISVTEPCAGSRLRELLHRPVPQHSDGAPYGDGRAAEAIATSLNDKAKC